MNHREDLHERGPPLTQQERELFRKEARTLTYAGLFTMLAFGVDAYLLGHPSKSQLIFHALGEATGGFLMAGIAAEYMHAATERTAVFSEVRETIMTNTKKFGVAAAFAVALGLSSHVTDDWHQANVEYAHSEEAKTLPKMDADKILYAGNTTTPRHFCREEDDVIVFQKHLVDCTTPAPQNFRPLSSALNAAY
jgi:hypothetical protein